MKKIVRLTESDLVRIVKRVINEETTDTSKKKPEDINFEDGKDYFFTVFGKDKNVIKNKDGKPVRVAMSVKSVGGNSYDLISTDNYEYPQLKPRAIYTYKNDAFTFPHGIGSFKTPGTSYYLALSMKQLK
jgi:hypothetical protein